MLAALHEVVDAATRSFDDYDYARSARADRAVLLGLLRRLSRAREAACVRFTRRRRRSIGSHRTHGCTLHAAATVRAAPSVRDRRGVVVVAARFGAPRRRGQRSRSSESPVSTRACTPSRPPRSARSARRRATSSDRCAPRSCAPRCTSPRNCPNRSNSRSTTCAKPVGSTCDIDVEPGDELRVEVELADPDPA